MCKTTLEVFKTSKIKLSMLVNHIIEISFVCRLIKLTECYVKVSDNILNM